MNAAASGSNGGQPDLERLFAEIAALKDQRHQLQRQLVDCRRENRALRAQIEGKS